MSYKPLEYANQMLHDRWGRMVEDPSQQAPPQWVANDNPRKLAAEYIQLSSWAILLEQELERATALLSDLGDRLHGAPELISPQVLKGRNALDAQPAGDKPAPQPATTE